MSKVGSAGSVKNVHDSPGQRLGVKRFGGEKVNCGEVLVRQVGRTKVCGPGTFMARNFTIHAAKDGRVKFSSVKRRNYTGRNINRVSVSVVD